MFCLLLPDLSLKIVSWRLGWTRGGYASSSSSYSEENFVTTGQKGKDNNNNNNNNDIPVSPNSTIINDERRSFIHECYLQRIIPPNCGLNLCLNLWSCICSMEKLCILRLRESKWTIVTMKAINNIINTNNIKWTKMCWHY